MRQPKIFINFLYIFLYKNFFFGKFRSNISSTYRDLFQEQVPVVDTEDDTSFSAHWGWYSAISHLSQDKVWEISKVTNLSLVACLNHLAYLIDLDKEKNKKLKE